MVWHGHTLSLKHATAGSSSRRTGLSHVVQRLYLEPSESAASVAWELRSNEIPQFQKCFFVSRDFAGRLDYITSITGSTEVANVLK